MPAASVRAAAAAVTFLTRVPIGRAVPLDGSDVARGAVLFPLVGAGVGALSGGVAVLLHPWLPSFASAGIALAVAVLLTGAMHVDALADTFDAAGAPTRERALEIMRDSRVGAFGASAIALDLLVKAGAIAALLDRGAALPALIAAGAVSRAASAPLAALLAYPRAEGGPGSVLTGRISRFAAAVTVVLAVGIAVLAAGASGAAMAGAAGLVTICLGLVYLRRLGGATGDALGAVTEIAETAALVVAAGLA
jgi:cobalamin 5'-phosphate synthase/cobalamin synthase